MKNKNQWLPTDRFTLLSTMPHTEYELMDIRGKVLFREAFDGAMHSIKLDLTSGLYLLRYTDPVGLAHTIKLIKK